MEEGEWFHVNKIWLTIAGFEDERRTGVKECKQPQEGKKGKKIGPSLASRKEHSPGDTLI